MSRPSLVFVPGVEQGLRSSWEAIRGLVGPAALQAASGAPADGTGADSHRMVRVLVAP
jgi:hypothetical protein